MTIAHSSDCINFYYRYDPHSSKAHVYLAQTLRLARVPESINYTINVVDPTDGTHTPVALDRYNDYLDAIGKVTARQDEVLRQLLLKL